MQIMYSCREESEELLRYKVTIPIYQTFYLKKKKNAYIKKDSFVYWSLKNFRFNKFKSANYLISKLINISYSVNIYPQCAVIWLNTVPGSLPVVLIFMIYECSVIVLHETLINLLLGEYYTNIATL